MGGGACEGTLVNQVDSPVHMHMIVNVYILL